MGTGPFRRIATFPVFANTDESRTTSAEIVAATADGRLLVYTDARARGLGFVDLSVPSAPAPAGFLELEGEPTSVAVRGPHALACVSTSESHEDPSGHLAVVDLARREVVRVLELGGQPDCLAVAPDGAHAVCLVENERDETRGDGGPPQAPPGWCAIVDLAGPPADWTTRRVELVGLAGRFPEDPEPEFADVNAAGIAALTLQENDAVVLVSLAEGRVVGHFSTGGLELGPVDVEADGRILPTGFLHDVAREPDGVAWVSSSVLVTANEGDLGPGGRGFTLWSTAGEVLHEVGGGLERELVRAAHFPERRADVRGAEPESVEVGRFGDTTYLFVALERGKAVAVYELPPEGEPVPLQILPAGAGPEGLLALPARDLLVVACEVDDREGGVRSTLMVYARDAAAPAYPDVLADDDPATGRPIPWGALSGLAADPADDRRLWAVHDGTYLPASLLELDRSGRPARVVAEHVLRDPDGVLREVLDGPPPLLPHAGKLLRDDGTLDLDLEGVAAVGAGRFWLVSEGAGELDRGESEEKEPYESPNLLLEARLAPERPGTAVVTRALVLPERLAREQSRFGLEGVAAVDGAVYVAFQRAWRRGSDPRDRARLGCYDLAAEAWTFAWFPLDDPASPLGGHVGLADLAPLPGGDLAAIERDDRAGPDARIKRIYRIPLADTVFVDDAATPRLPTLRKELVLDLVAAGVWARTTTPVPEKPEGLAVLSDGTALVVNDNDGLKGSGGETRLVVLERLFD